MKSMVFRAGKSLIETPREAVLTFGGHPTQGCCLVSRGQAAAKYPSMQERLLLMLPTSRNYLSPDFNCIGVEKLYHKNPDIWLQICPESIPILLLPLTFRWWDMRGLTTSFELNALVHGKIFVIFFHPGPSGDPIFNSSAVFLCKEDKISVKGQTPFRPPSLGSCTWFKVRRSGFTSRLSLLHTCHMSLGKPL